MAGHSHGHTPAAWTGAVIVFIGFCVSAAFTVMASPVGFWAGIAVVAVGGVVTQGMRMAGLGAPKPKARGLVMVGSTPPAALGTPEPQKAGV